MDEMNNNYNRSFETKTTKELQQHSEQFKTTGEKYAGFQQEVSKLREEVQNPSEEEKNRYNDTKVVEEEDKKEKKGNIITRVMDNLTELLGKSNKKKPEEEAPEEENFEETNYVDNDPHGVRELIPSDMSIQDIIAPIDLEVDFNNLEIGDYFFRTLFVSGYPRFVGPNWLSPIINFEHSLRISTFYYPVDNKTILEKLKKKIGEMEASLYSQMEDRKVVDPSLKVALADAQQLQDSIAEGTEKFFHFSMYITLYAKDKDTQL